MVVAVAMHTSWPTRQPSPTKCGVSGVCTTEALAWALGALVRAKQPAPQAISQLVGAELKTCYREPIRQTALDRSIEQQPSKNPFSTST